MNDLRKAKHAYMSDDPHPSEVENPFEQESKRKDAEIERLHKENLALVSEEDSLNYEIIKKDDEIERLKAQVKELSEAYQKAIGPIQPAENNQLITELCDALTRVRPHLPPADLDLIRRGREATR